MASKAHTRDQMLHSAVTLLREQGATAVTVEAVLKNSGAPRGSVYYHFPGGRNELLLIAGRTSADAITRFVRTTTETCDPLTAFDRFADLWRTALRASDFKAGCPVVAMSVDAREDLPEAAELVRETFAAWRTSIASSLEAIGKPAAEAASLATLAVSAIEGAILLCRAERDTAPLDQVVDQLRLLVPTRLDTNA